MRAPASTSSAIGLPEESQRHERRYRDGKRFADMPVGHGIGMGRVAVAAFAGLDWGFREHVACVVDGSGSVVAERSFGHGGAGLGSLAEWLRSHDAPAVAMETPRGAVAAFLLSREIEVRSINPRQSDRFRDRHSPSGSKDDRRDARVLANALRTDPQALRRVSAQRPEEVALGSLQRRLDWLGEDRGRLESRLRAELWEFYPEFETMAAGLKVGLATEWVLSLLERLPRPGTVRGVRDATLRKALKRARKVDAAGVRAALDVPTAATEARIEAGADAAAWLRRRLLETMREIAALERQRERLLDELKEAPGEAVREPGPAGSEGAPGEAAAADPARGAEDEPRRGEAASPGAPSEPAQADVPERPSDAWLLGTVPGLGADTLATLLANAGDAIRQRSLQALRCLCGTAPVTLQSGKSRRVVRRAAVDPDLRNAMYHCARVARDNDPGLRAVYDRLRQRGHGDARALRKVADCIVHSICAILQSRRPWDPSIRQPNAA